MRVSIFVVAKPIDHKIAITNILLSLYSVSWLEQTMLITLKNRNGIRTGRFDIAGVRGTFPTQVITSTNLNHAKSFDPNFDFKTQIVEIAEFDPQKLLSDSEYRKGQTQKFSRIIADHPNLLPLLTLSDLRSDHSDKSNKCINFTQKNNKTLIEFQKSCGFPLIKAFFNQNTRDVVQQARYCRSLVPRDRFVAAVDEDMSHELFRALYLDCLNRKDEIISFFGKKLTVADKQKHPDRSLNFAFLSNRMDDKILRMSSFIERSAKNMAASLLQHWYGLDAYSFVTRRWGPPAKPNPNMRVLVGFEYKRLSEQPSLVCAITGMHLQQSVKDFGARNLPSSIPASTYNIVKLNKLFETLSNQYRRDELREILASVNLI